jgi:hypothetical protein
MFSLTTLENIELHTPVALTRNGNAETHTIG